jgi:uncharacterized protein YbcI
MPAPQAPLEGNALLTAVTAAMVALHERYYHRRPGSAKTQLMGGDLLVCVMGEVYTDVEKTLIEMQRSIAVQESRSTFQQAMRQRFIEEVERLSGRHVMAFVSSHSVGPDMEIELFMLTPQALADAETEDGPSAR